MPQPFANEICKTCGSPISNDFGVTLAFCTNCGASIEVGHARPASGRGKLLPVIVIAASAAAVLASFLALVAVYSYFPRKEFIPVDPIRRASVPASEITKVTYSTWRHAGPMVGPGDGRVISQTISFASDLTASKTESVNYDEGDDRDSYKVFRGQIDPLHFARLVQEVVDNDFMNEPDSRNRRTESDARLIVTYKTGEKVILTSNTNQDTEEVKNILTTLTALDALVRWREAE